MFDSITPLSSAPLASAPSRRAPARPARPPRAPAAGLPIRERETQGESGRLRREVERLTALTRRQQAAIEGLSHALETAKAGAADLRAHNQELQQELKETRRAASAKRVSYR